MNMFVVAASLPLIFLSVVLSCAAASESYTTYKTVAIRGFIIVGTIIGLVSGTIAYFAVDDFVASLYMFCVAILAVGLPIYITSIFWAQKAKTYHDHAVALAQWSSENFARICGEGTEYITASDIERSLRNPLTSDNDRRMLSWLQSRLCIIGREMELYRSYSVSIEYTVNEMPLTTQVFGITREDLTAYPDKVRNMPEMSWRKERNGDGLLSMFAAAWPR